MKRISSWGLFLILAFAPALAFAEGKISGMVFGDLFWNAKNHSDPLEDKFGFWIRRGYFTYDQPFNDDFSSRFRLEVNSPDLTKTSANMTPYLKEASLQWKPTHHAVQVGLIPTPAWLLLTEPHWGYRSVERTPLDLQRLGNAVDLGVAVLGSFDEAEKFGYHLMFGNGSGINSETNNGKKVYGAFHVKPIQDLVLQIYGDLEPGGSGADRYTLQGFGGYKKENWRTGLTYIHRISHLNGADTTLKILSGYGTMKIVEKWWSFVRVDRQFDPNPDGNNIAYLPFDNTARSTFAVAGADFEPTKNIHLIPNTEAIFYDKVNGTRPGTDLVPRFTFFWVF